MQIKNNRSYIAEDGTVFYSSVDCVRYEKKVKEREEQEKKIADINDRLEITEMRGFSPYRAEPWDEDWTHRWYRVHNEEDLKQIFDVFEVENWLKEKITITEYPTCLHLGCRDAEEYDGSYFYAPSLFNETLERIQDFLVAAGYKVTLEKGE
ncbi:hypothetical protein M2146_002580 [Lachnospiraceae bacterium PF1-22]